MKLRIRAQAGFTLVEIAIVLIIVTILIGFSVAMLPVQQELREYRQAEREMDDIIDHLIAFAQVNGRLPCPDTSTDTDAVFNAVDGLEDTLDLTDNALGGVVGDGLIDSCEAFFGFIPSGTLGMDGDINANGVLQDPWGLGYGYAVSNIVGALPASDLVSPNGIREEGIPAYTPNPFDLFVCNNSTVLGPHLNCAAATGANPIPVAGNVAVVITSLGKDNNLGPASSNIQQENFDDFHNGRVDKVFISASRSDVNNAQFDDVIKWISPNLIFSKMIEADQLP